MESHFWAGRKSKGLRTLSPRPDASAARFEANAHFFKGNLSALAGLQSVWRRSARLSFHQRVFLGIFLGRGTQNQPLSSLRKAAASPFLYLCYGLSPSSVNGPSGHVADRLGGFLRSVARRPKAGRRARFFGALFRRLSKLSARRGPEAEGRRACTFFRGTFPKAGGAFREALPGGRRPTGVHIFSGDVSEGFPNFPRGVARRPKVGGRERFFEVHFRTLLELFARRSPAAEGWLAYTFFRGTFPKAGGAFCEA